MRRCRRSLSLSLSLIHSLTHIHTYWLSEEPREETRVRGSDEVQDEAGKSIFLYVARSWIIASSVRNNEVTSGRKQPRTTRRQKSPADNLLFCNRFPRLALAELYSGQLHTMCPDSLPLSSIKHVAVSASSRPFFFRFVPFFNRFIKFPSIADVFSSKFYLMRVRFLCYVLSLRFPYFPCFLNFIPFKNLLLKTLYFSLSITLYAEFVIEYTSFWKFVLSRCHFDLAIIMKFFIFNF